MVVLLEREASYPTMSHASIHILLFWSLDWPRVRHHVTSSASCMTTSELEVWFTNATVGLRWRGKLRTMITSCLYSGCAACGCIVTISLRSEILLRRPEVMRGRGHGEVLCNEPSYACSTRGLKRDDFREEAQPWTVHAIVLGGTGVS